MLLELRAQDLEGHAGLSRAHQLGHLRHLRFRQHPTGSIENAQHLRFRELDLVRVKGKHHPVAIHELLAAPAAVVAEYRELALWQPTLVAYREGDLAAARAGFTAFAAANPDDLVARLYLERLAELGDVAPAGWDGVITYQRK